jgi:4-diphosphocytidyl-2-C-methyl-D-erythritol kinase
MVWQAISLYDNLLISHNLHAPSMTVTGIDNERIPTDSREFGDQNGLSSRDEVGTEPQLHFELAKWIPTEAGLCGGSADAAADLVGCNLLWEANLSDDILAALGAKISERRAFLHQRNVGHRHGT